VTDKLAGGAPATLMSRAIRIGLISDTHGLLRSEALAALRGSDRIVHAGDIGTASILNDLAAIAPVTAVRGNNDRGAWAACLRETETIAVGGILLHVIHDVSQLGLDPSKEGIRVVIAGHSHRPHREERAGVLYVNPGSAGPRRFKLPVSVGELVVSGSNVTTTLTTLQLLAPA
jgi:putative phosphoesterase